MLVGQSQFAEGGADAEVVLAGRVAKVVVEATGVARLTVVGRGARGLRQTRLLSVVVSDTLPVRTAVATFGHGVTDEVVGAELVFTAAF